MKTNLLLFIGCLVLMSTHAAAQGFRVSGTQILDPGGQPFVAKGVNINGYNSAWGGDTPGHLHLVKNVWKFNLVRVYNRINPAYNGFNKDKQYLYQIIDQYTAAGMVVMPEVHDRTGSLFTSTSVPSLADLKAFWVDLAVRYKDNPYVWFNIMNEPGPITADWLPMHQEVIQAIREAGAVHNIIVCDGSYWAQESGTFNNLPVQDEKSAFLTWGPEVLAFNRRLTGNDNVVFSAHFYREWVWGDGKMADYLDRVQAKGLALLIGEYGAYTNNPTMEATYSIARVAYPRNVGRVVWHWFGGDQNDLTTNGNGGGQYINRTDGIKPSNLTPLGEIVWRDNHNLPPDPEAPGAPPGLAVSKPTTTTVQLSWLPATDNVNVAGYRVYQDGRPLGTVIQTRFTAANLLPGQQYSFMVTALDESDNESAGTSVSASTVPEGPQKRTLRPVADAHVQTGAAATNFGTASLLVIKGESSGGTNRRAYLKFDVSGVDKVKTAILKVYGSNTENSQAIRLSAFGTGDDWTETAITWNTTPAAATPEQGVVDVSDAADYRLMDVTEYVQHQRDGDKMVSLLLSNAADQNRRVDLASRENTTRPPELVISYRDTQTVTFVPITDKTYGAAPFRLNATASSGLPVTYAIVSGPATLAENEITLTGAGSVTVRATQGGSEDYEAAFAEQTFIVQPAPQTITFGPIPNQQVPIAPFPVAASAGSELPVLLEVVSGPASVSGNTLTLTGPGLVTLKASQPGNENYAAAEPVLQSFLAYEEDLPQDAIKIIVYPNPTAGKLKVIVQNPGDEAYTLRLYNRHGEAIATTVLERSPNVSDVYFDISAASTGEYFVEITDGTYRTVRRVLKQ